mmetsp:Transcript_34722/g.68531  ORF Transcript_34722/g.68531 Transcript_34722/m.68531 type:complete len:159 (+) Transcript_34722:71-547(+)
MGIIHRYPAACPYWSCYCSEFCQASRRKCSFEVSEELVSNAVVLALRKLLILALAVALSISAHADASDALVVLHEPRMALREAFWLQLVKLIFDLLSMLQVWGMVLREMLEERWAVGEAHCKVLPKWRRSVPTDTGKTGMAPRAQTKTSICCFDPKMT